MGIITKASDFISENPPLIADKAGDCLTSFSQQQVLDINKRRKQYLESAPDMLYMCMSATYNPQW